MGVASFRYAVVWRKIALRYRLASILVLQIGLVLFAYICAFALRFDFQISREILELILKTFPILLAGRLISYFVFKLNSGWWRFVNIQDIMVMAKAVVLGTVLFLVALVFVFGLQGFPPSVLILEAVLNLTLLAGTRCTVRSFRERLGKKSAKHIRHVLIVGAGDAGGQILNEIHANPGLGIRVVGFIDDDPLKRNAYIHGVRVLGSCEDLATIIARFRVDEVIISIPSASHRRICVIARTAREIGVNVKVLPGLLELIEHNGLWRQLREVPFDSLLGRPVLRFRRESDCKLLRQDIQGRNVLITGAAGSIGSELARQTLEFQPRNLILYDRNENDQYFLELELRKRFPDRCFWPVIGDLGDGAKLDAILSNLHVHLIYHAAAYKHVPMMEREPFEAVRNNILSTKSLATLAIKNKVAKFVNISTDKAVNPTSVMGTSKRVAELTMQAYGGNGTRFVTVRFGNVIGSNGSVVHLFRKQIERGEPLTVTHPEVSRYFMSIPEAVQLVMIAGAMGKGGEIFLLDMGKPIRIVDLAKNLAESCGLSTEKDVEIEYVGLRPGEKLHEELYWQGENILPTDNKKITMLKCDGIRKQFVLSGLALLEKYVAQNNREELIETLQRLVPESSLEPGLPESMTLVSNDHAAYAMH